MKTTKQELSISDVVLNCELSQLDKVQDHQSHLIDAWNGKYLETIFHTDKTYKVTTKISKLGKSMNTVIFTLHPTYNEWERNYCGDTGIGDKTERIFTEQELIDFHSLNLSKVI